MPKSILFVQHKKDSVLAKEIRRIIQELKPWTRLNIKVVERASEKLEDVVHKSNAWEEQDCGRTGCLPCETATKVEESRHKNCTRRLILYKTWCKICRKENVEKLGDTENNKRKMQEQIEKEDYVYIGESSRSANERGLEHIKDLEYLRDKSHMLKHAVMKHPEMHPSEVEFGMDIVSQHKTAFERQLTEAVQIRRRLGEKLLNSKLEHNRCYIPKIVVKIYDKESKNTEAEKREQS